MKPFFPYLTMSKRTADAEIFDVQPDSKRAAVATPASSSGNPTLLPQEVFVVVSRRDYDFPDEEGWNNIEAVYTDLKRANQHALDLFSEHWYPTDWEEALPDFGQEDQDEWTIPGTSGLHPDGDRRGVYRSDTREVRFAGRDDE